MTIQATIYYVEKNACFKICKTSFNNIAQSIDGGTYFENEMFKIDSMKNLVYPLLLFVMVSLSSCEVIGGIFKAGVWVGVLVVVGIIALIIFLVSKASGKR